MIKSITIENFKSIKSSSVRLGPLTVLIGPNGSGKSNFVKALQFLGAVARKGLQAAVNLSGGFSGLLPKAISPKDLSRARMLFQYRVAVVAPDNFPEDREPLMVEHELELARQSRDMARVSRERLVFEEPLAVGWALRQDTESEDAPPPTGSSMVFERVRGGSVRRRAAPSITKSTIEDYLSWYGLGFLHQRVSTRHVLEEVIKNFAIGSPPRRVGEKLGKNQSFLDPEAPIAGLLAGQYLKFRGDLASIRRYDLLLNELRKEQPASASLMLATPGSNMPSLLRAVSSNTKGEETWHRILSTFRAIAPHVDVVRSGSLRTGKEFVEFIEDAAMRAVESWESSDGTLRALAILLAVETHPSDGIVLIEEPEQNLHPWAVRTLIDHLRSAIGERELQVVMTTHSQQVLESVDPLEVLVVTRDPGTGTCFKPVVDVAPSVTTSSGELGRLWVKGLLGGVPSG